MRRLILVAVVLVTSLAAAQEKPNVSFEWAFATLSSAAKEPALVPIARDTALQTGDPLKMMVRLKTECFVYVIHENPAGEIALRFPYDLKQFTTDYKTGKNYFVPKGREWFTLDTNAAKIRRITDTTGRPLWEPTLTAGEPDRLLGYPMVLDPNVAAFATAGGTHMAFGNFSSPSTCRPWTHGPITNFCVPFAPGAPWVWRVTKLSSVPCAKVSNQPPE